MENWKIPIDSENLHEFFALVGQGIMHIQHVEDALSTCLALKIDVKEKSRVTPEEAYRMLAKHRGNTFGTSLKIAEKNHVLSSELMSALKEFKEKRDWLVHKSLNQNGNDIYSHNSRTALFHRLGNIIDEAIHLQKLVASEIESFALSKGVTEDEIRRRTIAELNRKTNGHA